MGNEGGDYDQSLGEGGFPPNLIGIFCRLNLEVKMEIFDNFEYFEDFGDDRVISDSDHDKEGIGDRNGVSYVSR